MSSSQSNNEVHPTTYVNGKGMYRSWKRNFKSPFFAMLDIIDNAIDAGMTTLGSSNHNNNTTFEGKVDIHENKIPLPQDDDVVDINDKEGGGYYNYMTGLSPAKQRIIRSAGHKVELVVVNNSIQEIKPLKEILQIHNSGKGDTGDIGENGVGRFLVIIKVYIYICVCVCVCVMVHHFTK